MGVFATGTVSIEDALANISTLFKWALGVIAENPLLLLFFVVPLAGLGFGLLRKAKKV